MTTTYFILGICLALAFFVTLNLLGSVLASVLWRIISKPVKDLSSRQQERIIFALRVFPIVAAAVFILAFVLPAYLLFEPHSPKEVVSFKLVLISTVALSGIGIASFHVLRTWLATRRLTASWLDHSELIAVENVNIPVHRIQHPFPVIAVVGMLRPRLFVASQIFDSLSADEFRAAIAHEYGHLQAHDNFKRAFLRVCRDMLIFPLGRELDRAWADNMESAADEFAAQVGGNSMALNLAETLLKIARIVPANASPAMPLGSFLIEARHDSLKHRVRRLVKLSDAKNAVPNSSLLRSKHSLWFPMSLFALAVGVLASNTELLFAVHIFYENVVAILQ